MTQYIMADNDIILSERESKIAIVLFEIMKPQIEKMIDEKLDGYKESEFDIHDHTGAIEEIIYDYVRYNITISSTID